MKINATNLKKITPPEEGYSLHWDDDLRGFGIRVTPTGKISYIAQARVNGKERRITLGRHGTITADKARSKAKTKLGTMADGVDPADEKKRAEALSVTLADVTEDYLSNRRRKDGKPLKDRTKADVRYHLKTTFPDWSDKPVVSITREMIKTRYAKRAKASPAQANQAMRVLSSIINFAAATYRTDDDERIVKDNPVSVLRESSVLRSVEARSNCVPLGKMDEKAGIRKGSKIGLWWSAVESMRTDPALTTASRSAADLVALLALTGLRLGEARSIRWDQIELDECSLALTDTKNRSSVVLPLSDAAVDLLKARQNKSKWVFPARSGDGHLMRIETHMAKLSKETGIEVTAHDLRRTFIQCGFKVLGIELWRMKLLANHKVPKTDITLQNYGDLSDRQFLKTEADRIAKYYEEQRRIFEADNVVPMERRA